MRALPAALRALPLTFVVYVVEALLALLLSVPLAGELGSEPRALGGSRLSRAAALEHALALLPALRVHGRSCALVALLLLSLSPLLRMAWLSALAAPLAPGRALAEGARLYLRACAASLALAIALALGLSPWALVAYLLDTLIDPARHARLHDLALLACAASALPMLWLAHVAHDLAHAFALRYSGLASARSALRAAFSPRTQLVALLLGLVSLSLGALPLLPSTARGPGALGAVALLQAGCFAALVARSVWLAYALTCTERQSTSRVQGE